jgi:hypothetical protein
MQQLVLGKQKINWSQDTTFHLIDMIGPSNARRSNVGLHEYDVYLREGTSAIRQMGSGGGLRWDLVIADASHNQVHNGVWQWATRVSTNMAGSDISVLFERTHGYSIRSGLSFSRNLNEDWGLYTEVLHAGEREIPNFEEAAPAIPISPSLVLPALSRFSNDHPKRETSQLLTTLRRNINEFGLAEVSYYFNGNGLSAKEWRDYVDRIRVATSTYTQPEFRAFYPNAGANPNGSFLGDAARWGEWHLMRRHYISLRIDTLENLSLGRLEISLLRSLEDGGSTVMVTLRRTLTERIVLSPFVIKTFAPSRSEAATIPVSLIVGIGLHASF